MNDEQKIRFLHFMIAMAWTDGTLDPAERDHLLELVERIGLSDESTKAKVRTWLMTRPNEPDWDELRADQGFGKALLHEATLLSTLDMSVSASEMNYLHQLRERIGITLDDFYTIQQVVEKELIARMNS